MLRPKHETSSTSGLRERAAGPARRRPDDLATVPDVAFTPGRLHRPIAIARRPAPPPATACRASGATVASLASLRSLRSAARRIRLGPPPQPAACGRPLLTAARSPACCSISAVGAITGANPPTSTAAAIARLGARPRPPRRPRRSPVWPRPSPADNAARQGWTCPPVSTVSRRARCGLTFSGLAAPAAFGGVRVGRLALRYAAPPSDGHATICQWST